MFFNTNVPTPFYHLFLVNELLSKPDLPDRVQSQLEPYRDVFSLGCVAPDVQTVSRQSRDATHFFKLPYQDGAIFPWERMLASHPSLARSSMLSPEQAAFIAGYLCHLQADWLWILEIFIPIFGPAGEWESYPRRLCLHNVLRAYLDEQILPSLPSGLGEELAGIGIKSWLPFVEEQHLRAWRNILVEQLQPAAPSRTVEIFASRDGISPDEFHRILGSEALIEKEIFTQLPRQRLQTYLQLICSANQRLLAAYLA